MSAPEGDLGAPEGDLGSVTEVKLLLLEELIAALRADPDKIAMWEIEGVDPTFYVLRFSLSGAAQARVDALAVERGLWGMGPAPK